MRLQQGVPSLLHSLYAARHCKARASVQYQQRRRKSARWIRCWEGWHRVPPRLRPLNSRSSRLQVAAHRQRVQEHAGVRGRGAAVRGCPGAGAAHAAALHRPLPVSLPAAARTGTPDVRRRCMPQQPARGGTITAYTDRVMLAGGCPASIFMAHAVCRAAAAAAVLHGGP